MNSEQALAQAKALAKENLIECVKELRAWQDTGLLDEGKFRHVVALCRNLTPHGAHALAAQIVSRAALDHIADNV